MKNKYLIFDLDGTLLNKLHEINYSSIEALEEATNKGCNVAIATGRSYKLAIDEIKMAQVKNYSILCNGALIYDVKKSKIIRNAKPLKKELIKAFLDLVKKYDSGFLVYTETENYFYSNSKDARLAFKPYLEGSIDLTNLGMDRVEKFLESNDIFTLTQYSKNISSNDFMKEFEEFKTKKELCNMSSAIDGFVDIYPMGISKWSGFLKLQELMKIDINDVYYFGDSMNDLEMIQKIPNSVAMGNAVEQVKKHAKYKIGDNDTDAIAKFVYDILDNKV